MPASDVSVLVNGASTTRTMANTAYQAAQCQSRVTEFVETDPSLYRRLSQSVPNGTGGHEARARDTMRKVDKKLQQGAK
ncbi:hypothetical protein CPAR01_07447 [Colletotrichum paranaense]|uniref:Uncharacterized protein n=1 Tax=Colletotrichum paranaense TaxID=1914294 RepID=A0ABQ9SPL7_9PEZI|nr:uncharacterized protein CPAR01_07447 [Colletotrichum paranaense]KAK1541458.1 hypothetical protein CPAR01_07447 [Colletotrichum paranaense]